MPELFVPQERSTSTILRLFPLIWPSLRQKPALHHYFIVEALVVRVHVCRFASGLGTANALAALHEVRLELVFGGRLPARIQAQHCAIILAACCSQLEQLILLLLLLIFEIFDGVLLIDEIIRFECVHDFIRCVQLSRLLLRFLLIFNTDQTFHDSRHCLSCRSACASIIIHSCTTLSICS